MENKKRLSLIGSIVILSISILVAASLISNAINNAGWDLSSNLSTINMTDSVSENYELLVNEGWLYLYDTTTGQVWKKADDPNATWEEVKHFTE